jgi:Ala-tRNA(Pro) deacylase
MTATMAIDDDTFREARKRLVQRFTELGIAAAGTPYPEHASVEDGKRLRGTMAGTFTKNLLLRDKRGQFFLIAAHEDRMLDLKSLPTQVGAHRRLSFASPERMIELLGVLPGALTPLALINAPSQGITAVIDASLMHSEQVNFHPLISTESVGLHPSELLTFLRSTGHEPLLVDFDLDHQERGR